MNNLNNSNNSNNKKIKILYLSGEEMCRISKKKIDKYFYDYISTISTSITNNTNHIIKIQDLNYNSIQKIKILIIKLLCIQDILKKNNINYNFIDFYLKMYGFRNITPNRTNRVRHINKLKCFVYDNIFITSISNDEIYSITFLLNSPTFIQQLKKSFNETISETVYRKNNFVEQINRVKNNFNHLKK